MKSIRYAVLVAAVGLVLTGCGDEGTGGSPTTTTAGTPSSTTPSTTPTTAPAGSMPLTVTRTGGFAGFDDRVVVGADGIASVSTRGQGSVRCKLDASLLSTIVGAVGQVDWAGVGTTTPTVRHPDDLIIAVSAAGGLSRIEDPKVKPLVAPVSKLLTEATVPPGKLCKPV